MKFQKSQFYLVMCRSKCKKQSTKKSPNHDNFNGNNVLGIKYKWSLFKKNCRAINANFDRDIPMIHLLWRGEDTWRIGVLLFALVTRNWRLRSVKYTNYEWWAAVTKCFEDLGNICAKIVEFSIVCHCNCELWFIQEQNYKVQWCIVCQQRHLHLTLIFLMC